MTKRVCIIDGHPDRSGQHLVDGLCDAYARGADWAGHKVSRINIGQLDFAFMRNADQFAGPPPEPVLSEREKIAEAEHVVMVYPLWLGAMPAALKSFLEITASDGFMISEPKQPNAMPVGQMKGKSARLIVTMGMPGLIYKVMFGAHSLKATELGIMKIAGFGPVRHSVFGMVDELGDDGRARILKRVERLGERAI